MWEELCPFVFGLASMEGTQDKMRHCGIVPSLSVSILLQSPQELLYVLLLLKATVDNENVLN